MRLASFNVENLFDRARALNQEDWTAGKPILQEFSKFNDLIQKTVYTSATKTAIIASLEKLGLKSNDENKFVLLRQNLRTKLTTSC